MTNSAVSFPEANLEPPLHTGRHLNAITLVVYQASGKPMVGIHGQCCICNSLAGGNVSRMEGSIFGLLVYSGYFRSGRILSGLEKRIRQAKTDRGSRARQDPRCGLVAQSC